MQPINGVLLHKDRLEIGSREYLPNPDHMSRREYLSKIESPMRSIGKAHGSNIVNTTNVSI